MKVMMINPNDLKCKRLTTVPTLITEKSFRRWRRLTRRGKVPWEETESRRKLCTLRWSRALETAGWVKLTTYRLTTLSRKWKRKSLRAGSSTSMVEKPKSSRKGMLAMPPSPSSMVLRISPDCSRYKSCKIVNLRSTRKSRTISVTPIKFSKSCTSTTGSS